MLVILQYTGIEAIKDDLREIEWCAKMIRFSKNELILKKKRIGMLQTHRHRKNPYSKENNFLKMIESTIESDNKFIEMLNETFCSKMLPLSERLDKEVNKLIGSQASSSD